VINGIAHGTLVTHIQVFTFYILPFTFHTLGTLPQYPYIYRAEAEGRAFVGRFVKG
jgi:hypothetical protein